jgi:hypothetical protein
MGLSQCSITGGVRGGPGHLAMSSKYLLGWEASCALQNAPASSGPPRPKCVRKGRRFTDARPGPCRGCVRRHIPAPHPDALLEAAWAKSRRLGGLLRLAERAKRGSAAPPLRRGRKPPRPGPPVLNASVKAVGLRTHDQAPAGAAYVGVFPLHTQAHFSRQPGVANPEGWEASRSL